MLTPRVLLLPQTYSQLAHPIQQAKAAGLKFHSKILDIDNIDVNLVVLVCLKNPWSQSHFSVFSVSQLAMGKMMDQGPVLIITFQAQLVMVIRNAKGEVVEGDPVGPCTPLGRVDGNVCFSHLNMKV